MNIINTNTLQYFQLFIPDTNTIGIERKDACLAQALLQGHFLIGYQNDFFGCIFIKLEP